MQAKAKRRPTRRGDLACNSDVRILSPDECPDRKALAAFAHDTPLIYDCVECRPVKQRVTHGSRHDDTLPEKGGPATGFPFTFAPRPPQIEYTTFVPTRRRGWRTHGSAGVTRLSHNTGIFQRQHRCLRLQAHTRSCHQGCLGSGVIAPINSTPSRVSRSVRTQSALLLRPRIWASSVTALRLPRWRAARPTGPPFCLRH